MLQSTYINRKHRQNNLNILAVEPFEGLATSSIKISSQNLQFCFGALVFRVFLVCTKHHLLLLLSSGDSLPTGLDPEK